MPAPKRPCLPLHPTGAPSDRADVTGLEEAPPHFTLLVLPFRHRLPAAGWRRRKILRKADRVWQHWWRRLHRPQDTEPLQRVLDDSYFFLPHVRQMLFPELALLHEGDASEQPGRAVGLTEQPLQLIDRGLPGDTMLRLTARGPLLDPLQDAELKFERDNERFSSRVATDWIDALLFPQGIGLLVIKTRLIPRSEPSVPALTTDDVADYLYYAKPVHQLTVGWQLAQWRCSTPGGAEMLCTTRDLIDALLIELAALEPAFGIDTLGRLAEARRGEPEWGRHASLEERVRAVQEHSRLRYTSTPHGQTYGDAFTHYSFLNLAEDALSDTRSGVTQHAPFEGRLEQACYELSECVDSSKPTFLPHPSAMREFRENNLFERWDNWVGVTRRDGIAFVCTRPTEFSPTLAHNVESDYFSTCSHSLSSSVCAFP